MTHTIIKIFLLLLLALLLLLVAATAILTTEWGQRWLYTHATQALEETLGTRVSIERARMNLFTGEITLTGAEIDDLRGERMLRIDSVAAEINLTRLLRGEIGIGSTVLAGVRAHLYKERPDTAANFQFIIDRLMPQEENRDTTRRTAALRIVTDSLVTEVRSAQVTWDVMSAERNDKGLIDANHLNISDLNMAVSLMRTDSAMRITLNRFNVEEKNSGMAFNFNNGVITKDSTLSIRIDSLHYHTDNGRARKNKGRPNRGWFDPGHMDLLICLQANVTQRGEDTVRAAISHLMLREQQSGLDVEHAEGSVVLCGKELTTSDVLIRMAQSSISIPEARLLLLNDKRRAVKLLKPCSVAARVVLQDLARPFAPALENFTTPLNLQVNVGGDLERMLFQNIRIATHDRRLTLSTDGDMLHTTDAQQLCLHFNNISLSARQGIKEQIVRHFAKQVRLKMMKQLEAIGDIQYRGKVGIYHRREDISGLLVTRYGNIDFAFTLNELTKYMTGTLSTQTIDFGSIMNIKGLQVGRAAAQYSFNISSTRGRADGGRLPQGWLKAQVETAKYRILSFRSIEADITSNGTEATGTVQGHQKLISVACDVTYRQTDKEQSLRFKPQFKLNINKKNKNKTKDRENEN